MSTSQNQFAVLTVYSRSTQCRKCSNIHLLFISFIFFAGLLLMVILFYLNLTVTSGTINGLILYTNIVWINKSYFHLHDRLMAFIHAYISTTNLGSPFEMCFYNGMNMYAKTWIQFAFPFYLILIATTL